MQIARGSRWCFLVAGEEGYGLVHEVIESRGSQITTWSEIHQGKETEPGYTWRGSKTDFLEAFKIVATPGPE